jgi:GT2 family glycosyltransferase
MTGTGAFAIVCAGGGPRAAAALRARFPHVPFRYAGAAASAPYGVLADPSPAAALRAVDTDYAIVVDPAVLLDEPAAQRLLGGIVEDSTIVAPVLLDRGGTVASAGTVLVADPVRGRAVAHAVLHGAAHAALHGSDAADAMLHGADAVHAALHHADAAQATGGAGTVSASCGADAFDGRCVAGRTETLRAIAPEACGGDAWVVATARARANGVALAVVPVTVRIEGAGVRADGDDPRRAAAESALLAHASQPWAVFAAEAASAQVRRVVRAPYGNDVHVVESAPRATAVVVGTPSDRAEFERMLRANALALDEIVYADESGADGRYASEPGANAVRSQASGAIAVADRVLLNRGDRYVAFADARTVLRAGWLDALAHALENDPFAAFATLAPDGCDARATLVAANRIPLADRLGAFETVHGALGDLMLRAARERGRGVARVAPELGTLPRPVDDVAFRARYGCAPAEADPALCAPAPRFSGIASIVMLSWNAPEYTRIAVESIRAHTRYPHEILVVDNGSEAPTLAVLDELERDHGVRVVRNGRNLGFGQGMNVGMAHARGDVIVILNNDVVVTDGWLEDLVGALELRRGVGCTAPRSNKVASEQLLSVQYPDLPAMHRFAEERRRKLRGRGYVAQRVVGFCMCLDREVIDAIGGFDPLYGIGNYEDDDLCVRIRGAGWQIFVCDDVFIHHFGSVSFKANALDYRALMYANWDAFRAKWGLPPAPYSGEYDIRVLGRPGFDPDRHFVPLPVLA